MESGLLIPLAATTPEQLRQEADTTLPRLIAEAGVTAAFAFDEFFRASIRNPHTRAAYSRAVLKLLAWLDKLGVSLAQITPGVIGGYFDELEGSIPTKKLALAAIRRFFDTLVRRHVIMLNPAGS
jgi:integrase/recombinase XerD